MSADNLIDNDNNNNNENDKNVWLRQKQETYLRIEKLEYVSLRRKREVSELKTLQAAL